MDDRIKKLFDEKLKPQIADELMARGGIVAQRKKIEDDRQAFLKKLKTTDEAVKVLETALDDKIITGKPTDEVLGKLTTRKGELQAYERHIQRLVDQDVEAAIAEKKANVALSAALGQAIHSLRDDIQRMFEDHLNMALETLIDFENAGHEAEAACGVELERDMALTVFRFTHLYEFCFKSLGAFLEPCGIEMSAARRWETRQQWAAKKSAEQAPVTETAA